jgi:fatty acid desaturase
MAARVMEDITRSELHRFEANLTASVRTAVNRATATVFRIASAVVGGSFMIAALVLFLGRWFPWWLSFALTGLIVIGIGEVGYYYTHPRNAGRP